MRAHSNQINFFLERANRHHAHDKEFMELVEKTDFSKLSTSTMQSLNKLISLAFMDSKHRLTIKKRLLTFNQKSEMHEIAQMDINLQNIQAGR